MLPTMPRCASRSMKSSETTPSSSKATRTSWGVELTIRSLVMEASFHEPDFPPGLLSGAVSTDTAASADTGPNRRGCPGDIPGQVQAEANGNGVVWMRASRDSRSWQPGSSDRGQRGGRSRDGKKDGVQSTADRKKR